eukprot:1493357-Heterocapsa_arctica.AAC.1
MGTLDPDVLNVIECGPLLGEEQRSDRAEVRALVASLGKSENVIEVIMDNQYVRDAAQYLAAGGMVHKGKQSDLWCRIKLHIRKLGQTRWVNAHLEEEKASAGVGYED